LHANNSNQRGGARDTPSTLQRERGVEGMQDHSHAAGGGHHLARVSDQRCAAGVIGLVLTAREDVEPDENCFL
jgi:hypothetical protein